MQKREKMIIGFLIVFLAGVAFYFFTNNREQEKTEDQTTVVQDGDGELSNPNQRERFGGNRYTDVAGYVEEQYQKALGENKIFILAGASEDKETIYYFTASNEPQNAFWGAETNIYEYKKDSIAPKLIRSFHGVVLDMYPEKNLALYMMINPESLKEQVVLQSLETNEETILFEKQLIESDGDIAEGPRIQGMVYFESAIINPSGTRAVISTIGPKETQSKEFGACASVDLMSGTIEVLDTITGQASPKLWENDETIILTRYLDDGDQETFSYTF